MDGGGAGRTLQESEYRCARDMRINKTVELDRDRGISPWLPEAGVPQIAAEQIAAEIFSLESFSLVSRLAGCFDCRQRRKPS